MLIDTFDKTSFLIGGGGFNKLIDTFDKTSFLIGVGGGGGESCLSMLIDTFGGGVGVLFQHAD